MSSLNTLILAAGFGTRLGHHGPKGLIPAGNSTILGRFITAAQGVIPASIALVTNHLHAAEYQTWLNRSGLAQIILIDNQVTRPADRLGALRDAVNAVAALQWQNQPLLIAPSDTLFHFDLSEFILFAQAHPDGLTTVFRAFSQPDAIRRRLGCGVIQGERLTAFEEKPIQPSSRFGAIPFYYYPASVLPLLSQYVVSHPDLAAVDAPGSIIPWLLSQKHPVYAYIVQTETLDVGTPADLKQIDTLQS